MKIKYLKNTNRFDVLQNWKIYNVFAIEIWKDWQKYYIDSWSNFIYPEDINDFEIVDNLIHSSWSFFYKGDWYYIIWPSEIYEKEYFWERYYDGIPDYIAVIDKYYELYKDVLFNDLCITEGEKQERKNKWWEFIDE